MSGGEELTVTKMLNLNTNNDYSMAFPHHLASTDQQFYHSLYTSVPAPIKDKTDFLYKNQKFDFINNNNSTTSNENFASSSKDCENSKRFSVNNLLKPPSDLSAIEKTNGEF